MSLRQYSFFDQAIIHFNTLLQSVAGGAAGTTRANPAADLAEPVLSEAERRHAAGLMRVNHVGEVCAQALYQGQALTARSPAIRAKLEQAASEEVDHLMWCQTRITELGSHTSYLNPLWYIGSLAMGTVAGLLGDKVSLGFLAETERQVERHLTSHLDKLPTADQRSRTIVLQMRADEAQHAVMAIHAGAMDLPSPVKFVMGCLSKVMTSTAYWV